MDEISTGASKKNIYDNSDREQFLDWLKVQVDKAGEEAEIAAEKGRSNSSYMMKFEYSNRIAAWFNNLKEAGAFLDSGAYGMRNLAGFKNKLQKIQTEYNNIFVWEWKDVKDAKNAIPGSELAERVKDEISAIDAAMDEIRKSEAEASAKTAEKEIREPVAKAEAPAKTTVPSDTVERQRIRILACAKALENAKTLVNSDEYKDLITIMKTVGSNNSGGMEKLGDSQKFAQELYAIHLATEKYLGHKAKDGVKKNSFNKLLAVERANNELKEIIKEVSRKNPTMKLIQQNGKSESIGLIDLKITLRERKEAFKSAYGEDVAVPKKIGNYFDTATRMQKSSSSMKKMDNEFIMDCLEDVDSCMCKIMLKAQENGNKTAYNSLDNMRKRLVSDPLEMKREKTTEVTKSNSKGMAK